ncbi:MAG: hypothetical protein DRP87_06305 [Spirochaetes bacterium]|nr:MAG: hypothetical protein DRP87_06305 [Spirochaetota bacterium]
MSNAVFPVALYREDTLKFHFRYNNQFNRTRNRYSVRRNRPGIKPEKNDRNTKKFLLYSISILFVILLGEILFQFIIAPRMLIEKIEIVTDDSFNLSDDEIMNIAGIRGKDFFLSVNTEKIKVNLEAYPLIKSANVLKIFPDTLKIELQAREPIAISLVNTEGITIPVAIDPEGVVFQIGSSISGWDLPVVSGVRFPDVKLGIKLPELLTPFLEDLQELKNSSYSLFSLISEIKFINKMDIDYEVVLFFNHSPIQVRIGNRLDETLLKYIMLLLDLTDRGELENIEEFDLRSGEVVFKTGED